MTSSRIVYQNWIVDLGRDPEAIYSNRDPNDCIHDEKRVEQIRRAVKAAIAKLDEDERELIFHYHYMGESYRKISDKSGWPVPKLDAMHKRTLMKLRKLLAPFVNEIFDLGPTPTQTPSCRVCNSEFVEELNEIISNRDRKQTWKPVLDLFRTKYNLVINSPQLLVGHEKYH